MRERERVRVRTVLTALVVIATTAAAPATATFPGDNGSLLFSVRGPRPGLFRIDPGGESRRRLTDGQDFFGTWSPDGRRIAFVHHTDTDSTIVVMRGDGTRKRTVSQRGLFGLQPPVWSPTGMRLAYTHDRIDDQPRTGAIFTVRRGGTGRRRLTSYASLNTHPTWSPDGTRIAFMSERDGDGEIWVMDGNGSNKTKLTDNDVLDQVPQWSPDGRSIVYVTTIPGPPGQGDAGTAISIMEADGSGVTKLTTGDDAFDEQPRWSPAGDRILFLRSACETPTSCGVDVVIVSPDGRAEMNLTQTIDEPVEGAAWSPDGKKVAVVAGDLFIVSVADGSVRRLTTTDADEVAPDWRAR